MSRIAESVYGDTPAPYPEKPGHVRGSDTSHAAARSMDAAASSIRDRVLAAIVLTGDNGATADELEATMGLHQTISARVRELVLMGKVRDSGRRRATRSGRSARIYVVAR